MNFFACNDAPPTNAPSTLSSSKIDLAFVLFTLPQYKIFIFKEFLPKIFDKDLAM